jgi:hypothetical protein
MRAPPKDIPNLFLAHHTPLETKRKASGHPTPKILEGARAQASA